jgi:magnesium chelatase family protein
VLFLDEIPEFPRSMLESIRQPLEDRMITINRTNGVASYPADFMLVATMNPCPCGYFGDATKECSCTSTQITSYQKRLSGPLLDRIDLTVNVSRVSNRTLLQQNSSTNKQHIEALSKINSALKTQRNRYSSSYKNNGNASTKDVKDFIHLSDSTHDFLANATDKLHLSARSYFKVLKVAQTIADLSGSSDITTAHISEALQYRQNS